MIDYDSDRASHSYPTLKSPIVLTVATRCPEKWLLVDRETGQVYEGNGSGAWSKLVDKDRIFEEEEEDES